jgi:hypothetical protein
LFSETISFFFFFLLHPSLPYKWNPAFLLPDLFPNSDARSDSIKWTRHLRLKTETQPASETSFNCKSTMDKSAKTGDDTGVSKLEISVVITMLLLRALQFPKRFLAVN